LEPRDLELKGLPLRLNPDIRPAMSSRHPGKVNYSTIDAQCRTLQENQLSPAQLKALITVADDD
jgi:hypothetical protein